MTHDDLARSLADHLRGPDRMVWCDIQLGPAGSVRPDVYTLCKSFVRPSPMAYEVKVSQSDFRADVTTGKWQSYLAYATGVYFACEAGLFSKADVPEHCGLIVLRDGRWRAAKKPVLQSVRIPEDALLKLVIDGVEREGPRYRQKTWLDSRGYAVCNQKLGAVVARTIQDRLAVEQEIASAKRSAEFIVADANRTADRLRAEGAERLAPLRLDLCSALGLPASSDVWRIDAAVRELKASIAQHPAETKLQNLTRALQHALAVNGITDEAGAA
jgi:hypothetical protein